MSRRVLVVILVALPVAWLLLPRGAEGPGRAAVPSRMAVPGEGPVLVGRRGEQRGGAGFDEAVARARATLEVAQERAQDAMGNGPTRGGELTVEVLDAVTGAEIGDARWRLDAADPAGAILSGGSTPFAVREQGPTKIALQVDAPEGYLAFDALSWWVAVPPEARRLIARVPVRRSLDVHVEMSDADGRAVADAAVRGAVFAGREVGVGRVRLGFAVPFFPNEPVELLVVDPGTLAAYEAWVERGPEVGSLGWRVFRGIERLEAVLPPASVPAFVAQGRFGGNPAELLFLGGPDGLSRRTPDTRVPPLPLDFGDDARDPPTPRRLESVEVVVRRRSDVAAFARLDGRPDLARTWIDRSAGVLRIDPFTDERGRRRLDDVLAPMAAWVRWGTRAGTLRLSASPDSGSMVEVNVE